MTKGQSFSGKLQKTLKNKYLCILARDLRAV